MIQPNPFCLGSIIFILNVALITKDFLICHSHTFTAKSHIQVMSHVGFLGIQYFIVWKYFLTFFCLATVHPMLDFHLKLYALAYMFLDVTGGRRQQGGVLAVHREAKKSLWVCLCKEYRDTENRLSTASALLATGGGQLLWMKKSSCGDPLSQEHHVWGIDELPWLFFA